MTCTGASPSQRARSSSLPSPTQTNLARPASARATSANLSGAFCSMMRPVVTITGRISLLPSPTGRFSTGIPFTSTQLRTPGMRTRVRSASDSETRIKPSHRRASARSIASAVRLDNAEVSPRRNAHP